MIKKSKTGLFLIILGVAIAIFPAVMTIRQLPYDPLKTPYLDMIWMFLTLPIGSVIAIFGLLQRSDAKTNKLRAPAIKPDQPADQSLPSEEVKAIYQTGSGSQTVLAVVLMFIGLNVGFGAISSFMNMNLSPSWGLLGAIQLLAAAGLILYGIRRLKKK
jgi:hypothetical protein